MGRRSRMTIDDKLITKIGLLFQRIMDWNQSDQPTHVIIAKQEELEVKIRQMLTDLVASKDAEIQRIRKVLELVYEAYKQPPEESCDFDWDAWGEIAKQALGNEVKNEN